MSILDGVPVLVVPPGRAPDNSGGPGRLVGLLGDAGCAATAATRDEALAAGSDVSVLLTGSVPFNRGLVASLAERAESSRPRVVLWHLEPLPPSTRSPFALERLPVREHVKRLLRDERHADPAANLGAAVTAARSGAISTIAVSSRGKAEVLAEHGVEAPFVPIGGEPPVASEHEREIDVLFLGDPRPRRRRRILARLRACGIDVVTAGDWGARGVWGDERAALLTRARVLLNLSRHPGDLAGMRLGLGMTYGAAVVSEPIHLPEPFLPGVHYAEADADGLPAVIRGLLADEGERRRLVDAGAALIAEHTLARSAERLAALLDPRSGSEPDALRR